PTPVGSLAPMPKVSILSMLRERASLHPNDPAFTFTDFEQEWAGVTDRLTWAQAYRRSLNVAIEVAKHGGVGDRAVILAPQGLETSWRSWALCMPGSLQSRCRCRRSAPTTSE